MAGASWRFAALAVTGLIVAAVPWLLLSRIGVPYPTEVPTLDRVQRAFALGDVAATTWLRAFSWLAWLGWGQFVVGLLLEVPAALKGGRARTVRGVRAGQWAARRLVGQLTVSATLVTHLATATGAGAAGLPDIEIITTVMEEGDGVGRLQTRWTQSGHPTLQPPSPSAGADLWTAGDGDHLWAMSERALTDAGVSAPTQREVADYWLTVIEENRDRLPDPTNPDLIHPGDTFILPHILGATSGTVEGDSADPPPEQNGAGTEATSIEPDVFVRPINPGSELEPTTSPQPDTTVAEQPAVVVQPVDGEVVATLGVEQPSGLVRTGLGVVGTGVGAAALVVGLRRKRHRQAQTRLPGELLDDPPITAAEVERQIRPIADHEAHRWVQAVNHWIPTALRADEAAKPPEILAVRAGTFGVELLLETPCRPIDGFVGDGELMWRVHPDRDVRTLEADTEPGHPYNLALTPVGTTVDGDLLLDFERMTAVSITGAAERTAGWMRSIAVGLSNSAWSDEVDVVAIGLELDAEHLDRITVPADPITWMEQALVDVPVAAAAMEVCPYEQRVTGDVVHPPTVVLVGPGHEAIGQRLAALTELAWSPFAVVTTAPLPNGHRIDLTGEVAVLEPFDVQFEPAYTPAATAAILDTLRQSASQRGNAQAVEPVSGSVFELLVPESTPTEEATQVSDVVELPFPEAVDIEPLQPPPVRPVEEVETVTEVGDDDGSPEAALPQGDEPEPAPLPTMRFTAAVTEQVRAILAPKPVEVRLLTSLPTVAGLNGDATPKQLGILGYLAYHRAVPADRIRDVFWPNSTNRATCDNMLARIRKMLGTTNGEARLSYDRSTARHLLHEDVGCDWTRAEQLLALAKDLNGPDEVQVLASAVGLIEGPAGRDAHRRHFSWLCDDHLVFTVIETALVDAAHRLGQAALAVGDPGLAKWAAEKGLGLVPGQEALLRIVMRACAAVEDRKGVEDTYRMAVVGAQQSTLLDEVSAETEALHRQLVS
jgi:hypothetical protein